MWVITTAHFLALLGAAIILIAAAINDARVYKIPNILCAGLILLFPLFAMTSPREIEWDQNLMVFGLTLAAGLGMFLLKLAGAGDIKLLAAAGLWAGPHYIALFFITTALTGGLLAFVMMGLTYMRNRQNKQALAMAKVPIPYGIAIAFGGLRIIYRLSEPIFFAS
jgi:prepilin peptidase CpaA